MTAKSCWAMNEGIRLHYLDRAGEPGGGLPILFVPGVSDDAREYEDLLEFFAPRRAIVMDLRGRGSSDSPLTGYAFEHLVSDVEAVVEAAGLDRLHLMTFSRGTTPALGFALSHPEQVASFSIGDYLAEQIALPDDWPATHMAGRWRGRSNQDRMQAHVAVRLQAEGEQIDLWDDLRTSGIPVLVATGGREGALIDRRGGLHSFKERLPECRVLLFPDSNHDLFRPERMQYPAAVAAFMRDVEMEMGLEARSC